MKDTYLILDNIRSAHNIGAIFRTADGAGVKKIFLIGITPYPPHEKLHKTALGAEEYVDWEYSKTLEPVITKLKEEGVTIYSVEQTDKALDYSKVEYPEKSAFIFGHEITGVSMTGLENSDFHIQLPMHGKKNSLNVSTTVGIVIYHVVNNV